MDEKLSRIIGEIDLSQISTENFKPEMDLRVGVVREGNILGSVVLKTAEAGEKRLRFEVEVVAPFFPGGRLPCPVTILVGPAIPDREFLQLQTTSLIVDLAHPEEKSEEHKDSGNFALVRQVGTIVVEQTIYLCWLFCCRTYTISGRVVCRHWHYNQTQRRWILCDEPVPGAIVEAYDVDRFWWWYWRDFISSAVTDINGNFSIHFTWCCTRWYPWFTPNLAVDPDIFSRIQTLYFNAQLPFPQLPPNPEPDPAIFQQLLGSAANLPGSLLRASSQSPGLFPALEPNSSFSAEALQAVLPPSPELQALRVWPWYNWSDCAPDVVFRVTQKCNDRNNVIYTETNNETRWNISNPLTVTLLANKLACCVPVCRDPECPECLKLTVIGCTQVDQISTLTGPPDFRGYARTGGTAADPYKDNPFFGSLQVRGAVGWDVDYFKVQYSKNGGAWTDLPTPAFGGFGRSYWDGSTFVSVSDFSPALKNGQTVIITRRHYEDTHPAIPRFGGAVIWNDFDTLFYFDTTNPALTPDALYELRFVAYATDAADNLLLASERILPTCGSNSAETVYLRIDNQGSMHPVPTLLHPCTIIHQCTNEPDCYIRQICKNEGQPDQICISACDIVRLKPTDTLTIHFSVTCPPTTEDGHLGGYWLRAEYGISQAFYITAPTYVDVTGGVGTLLPDPTPEVGPSYTQALAQGAPRPHWYGGDFKVTIKGSDFPECCAFLLRLWAWKRTTNGCSSPTVTHANQFEISFTVLRPDLCPNICDQDRN